MGIRICGQQATANCTSQYILCQWTPYLTNHSVIKYFFFSILNLSLHSDIMRKEGTQLWHLEIQILYTLSGSILWHSVSEVCLLVKCAGLQKSNDIPLSCGWTESLMWGKNQKIYSVYSTEMYMFKNIYKKCLIHLEVQHTCLFWWYCMCNTFEFCF